MTNYLEERLRIINAALATVTDDAEIEILLNERRVILDLLDNDVVF